MNIKMLKAAVAGLVLSISGFANAGLISFTPSGTSTVSQDTNLYWDMLSDSTSTSSLGAVGGFLLSDHGDIEFSSPADMVQIGATDGGQLFNFGDLIGATNNWSNSFYVGTNGFSGVMNVGDSALFGLSFQMAGQTHYGWVNIKEDSTTQSILGWGYESIAGKAIAAGATAKIPSAQVPEPSTLAIFALGIMGLASRRFKKQ